MPIPAPVSASDSPIPSPPCKKTRRHLMEESYSRESMAVVRVEEPEDLAGEACSALQPYTAAGNLITLAAEGAGAAADASAPLPLAPPTAVQINRNQILVVNQHETAGFDRVLMVEQGV